MMKINFLFDTFRIVYKITMSNDHTLIKIRLSSCCLFVIVLSLSLRTLIRTDIVATGKFSDALNVIVIPIRGEEKQCVCVYGEKKENAFKYFSHRAVK